MSAKQTLKQRKALRSAAAKKGWETRRREMQERDEVNSRRFERLRLEIEGMQNAHLPPRLAREPSWDDVSGIPDILRGAPAKPSLWQRVKGWFA